MSLDTSLCFFRPGDAAPPLHRREVMDAIVGRLPEIAWRERIAERGALPVAMNEFACLFDQNGIETLFDPPVKALLVAIRRIGDAPVYLSPLDLLRRFHTLGWIPEEQHAGLPPEALELPTEADAISLDRVLARFQPSGPDAHVALLSRRPLPDERRGYGPHAVPRLDERSDTEECSLGCLGNAVPGATAWDVAGGAVTPGTIGHGAVALAYAGRFVYAKGKVALGTQATRRDRGADANAIGIRTEG